MKQSLPDPDPKLGSHPAAEAHPGAAVGGVSAGFRFSLERAPRRITAWCGSTPWGRRQARRDSQIGQTPPEFQRF